MARVFCGLSLGIVEVSGDGDDRLRDFFTEKLRCTFLKIAKYERGNLRRGEDAIAHLEPDNLLAPRRNLKRNEAEIFLNVCAAHSHEPLNWIDRLARFGDQPIASLLADEQAV